MGGNGKSSGHALWMGFAGPFGAVGSESPWNFVHFPGILSPLFCLVHERRSPGPAAPSQAPHTTKGSFLLPSLKKGWILWNRNYYFNNSILFITL